MTSPLNGPFSRWGAEGMLLLVAMVWGASYGLAKSAVLIYPVLGFLAVRFCCTALLLLPSWRNLSAERAWQTLRAGVPLGLVLFAIFVCETYGVALARASSAAFLISLCVVFTPFAEWLILRARPSLTGLAAALLSLLGAWLLTSGTSIALNVGDGLMVLAAILRALMVTATTRLTRDHPVPALPLTSVQTGVVGIGSLLAGIVLLPGGLPPLPSDPTFWTATAFLIVFCTMFAFFAQNYALRRTSPTRVALLMGTEPVFGAVFAVLWLGESLSMMACAGGALIVGASLWASLKRA